MTTEKMTAAKKSTRNRKRETLTRALQLQVSVIISAKIADGKVHCMGAVSGSSFVISDLQQQNKSRK